MPTLPARFFRLALSNVKNMNIWGPTPEKARIRIEREARLGIRLPRGVTVRPEPACPVPAEWDEPDGIETNRTILYLHGGGYTLCSPATHRGLTSRIALEARARLLSLDYRLAPENKFPAALEDVLAAVRWLLAQGVPAARLAIGGDSAGGGLAVATALSLRDSGEPLPGALFLLSPWADLTFSGESARTRAAADPLLKPGQDGVFPRLYAGEVRLDHPLLSPVFAELSGLPPTLLHVGTEEILLSDSIRLADKLKAAGNRAELQVWQGMWHVFQVYAAWVPEARQSIQQIGEFLRKQIP